MRFISYAQNFEDVMLWRALKHVENGFYIDIGAQHPVTDSVSLAFYERGWRGVHVEPTQQYSSLLRAARPDETVFQLAVGNQHQVLTFFEFEDTGLSTADAQVASAHRASGFKCRETTVPILSLDALLQQAGAQDVHWLKVDVEGLEKEVLQSWKDSSNLPWVVVVESTRPLTQEISHGEWEPILIAKGYRYVYFDGLNRFYVSPEHEELIQAFTVPPNIFDDFALSGTASQPFHYLIGSQVQAAEAKAQAAEKRAEEAEAQAAITEDKLQQAESRALQAQANAQAALNQMSAQLDATHKSTSWVVTKPLRVLKRIIDRDFSDFGRLATLAKYKTKMALRPLAVSGAGYLLDKPLLRSGLKRALVRFPALHRRLSLIATHSAGRDGSALSRSSNQYVAATGAVAVAPAVRKVYADLTSAIANDKAGGDDAHSS